MLITIAKFLTHLQNLIVKDALGTYWWIMVYPGLALILYVLAWNLVGDAFRDALDPKMRGLRGG